MALKIGTGITIGGGITFSPVLGPVTANLVLNLDALDYSGSGTTWPATVGPDATLYNGVTWTDSGPGYFTFSPDSLQFADTPNIGNLNNWTVECWFKLTSDFTAYAFPALVTTVYELDGGINYGNINYTLSTYPYNTGLTNGYYNGTPGQGWFNTPTFAPTVGDWYQMIGTFDGTTLKTYINGIEISSAAGGAPSIANGGGIRIARRWDGDGQAQYFAPAEISVVRIYNTALNAIQVARNFDALRLRFALPLPALITSGLIQNLDAGDTDSYSGSGGTWTDLSGAGNDASLQGYAPWTDAGDQSYFVFSTGYADSGNILPNTAYTKIGIFKVTGNYQNLMSGDNNQHAFWGFGTQYLQSGHNANWATVVSPVTTPLNQWVFGAVTFDNTTGWKLYLNDNTPVTNGSTDQFTDNPALVQIGAYGGANNLNGEVAVSLIYNRALSEAEMAQNFAYYQARFGF